MTTMRQSYERYRALYANQIEVGSTEEAMLRGAFSAGVMHGLGIARLTPENAIEALDAMRLQLEDFWHREPPP